MHQHRTAFENIVGKGEIARNEQFLLFPQCFLLNQIIVSPFVHISDIIALLAAELEKPKFGISGKGLSIISHWIFPQCFFFISGTKSKNNLTLSQTTNFRLFQTERLCRQPFQI